MSRVYRGVPWEWSAVRGTVPGATSQRGVIPDKSRKGGSTPAADDYPLSLIPQRQMSPADQFEKRRKCSAHPRAQ
ncbi:hypothetical protein MPLB_1380031 [Mesorhizobium sp. ORS 3324]|nr:hypothetical protein MPLB_1380031 [Mesorhizobium sp. ORS 3324]